jgi:hypothetical protein
MKESNSKAAMFCMLLCRSSDLVIIRDHVLAHCRPRTNDMRESRLVFCPLGNGSCDLSSIVDAWGLQPAELSRQLHEIYGVGLVRRS